MIGVELMRLTRGTVEKHIAQYEKELRMRKTRVHMDVRLRRIEKKLNLHDIKHLTYLDRLHRVEELMSAARVLLSLNSSCENN